MIYVGARDGFVTDSVYIDTVRTVLRRRRGPVAIRIAPIVTPVMSDSKLEA